MQTSLNCLKIQQSYQFITDNKSNYLDLQFILLSTAKYALDIPKNIIFVNTVTKI